jgi:hypothetical protein
VGFHSARLGLCGLLGGVASCDTPPPQPVVYSEPLAKTAPALPEPVVSSRSKPAPRQLTDTETLLAGTWVAKVGSSAPRSSAVDGKVMLGIEPGQELVPGVMKAIDDDKQVSTACVWLELYENLHGFRNECALMNGEPSALQKNDPFTGAAQPFGIAFTWRHDGNAVVIDYAEALLAPDGKGGSLRITTARMGLEPGAGPKFRVTQTFPEHPDLPPQIDEFEIMSGAFLGDPPKP